MCAPQIMTDLQRPDYWVECRPCGYRSEDFLSFKDCAAAYAEHEVEGILSRLDGTEETAVAYMTGLSPAELEDLGGIA